MGRAETDRVSSISERAATPSGSAAREVRRRHPELSVATPGTLLVDTVSKTPHAELSLGTPFFLNRVTGRNIKESGVRFSEHDIADSHPHFIVFGSQDRNAAQFL